MQLFEAVIISTISTIIIIVLYWIRAKHKEKVSLYGPVAYKLDESGSLREIPSDSVPIKDTKALREKILSEVKLTKSPMLEKPTVIFFALTIFIVQLIILLLL